MPEAEGISKEPGRLIGELDLLAVGDSSTEPLLPGRTVGSSSSEGMSMMSVSGDEGIEEAVWKESSEPLDAIEIRREADVWYRRFPETVGCEGSSRLACSNIRTSAATRLLDDPPRPEVAPPGHGPPCSDNVTFTGLKLRLESECSRCSLEVEAGINVELLEAPGLLVDPTPCWISSSESQNLRRLTGRRIVTKLDDGRSAPSGTWLPAPANSGSSRSDAGKSAACKPEGTGSV
jgi:hypothetical protein